MALTAASSVARLPRVPWPWKVWPSGPARSVFRSLFSRARQRPLSYMSNRVVFQSANQRGGVTAAPCPIASPVGTSQTCRGCRENFSLPGRGVAPHTFPICQSPNQLISQILCVLRVLCDFQNILAVLPREPALIGSNLRNRRFPLRVPSWFFVFFVIT